MAEQLTTPHWPATGLFPVKIVGAHFYHSDIARIARNKVGCNALVFCTALLIPEENNFHDSNAILIKIDSEKVGHLSRDLALEFRNRLAIQGLTGQTTTCDAVISGGIETPDKTYDYIIELDLDISTEPTSANPTYPSIERRETCDLVRQGDRRYLIKVWLEAGVLENMHKSKSIDTWTTDHWDTIDYYVSHTKNCGLGHKLFSIPKSEHHLLFDHTSPIASFYSLSCRNAVIELVAGA